MKALGGMATGWRDAAFASEASTCWKPGCGPIVRFGPQGLCRATHLEQELLTPCWLAVGDLAK